MKHELAVAFFFGLLILLGAVLELTVKAHWAQIKAALKGDLPPRG